MRWYVVVVIFLVISSAGFLYAQNAWRDFRPMVPTPKAVKTLIAVALDGLYAEKDALAADIIYTEGQGEGYHVYVKDASAPDGRKYDPKAEWLVDANERMARIDAHIAELETSR